MSESVDHHGKVPLSYIENSLRVSQNQMLVDEDFDRAGLTSDADILKRYGGSSSGHTSGPSQVTISSQGSGSLIGGLGGSGLGRTYTNDIEELRSSVNP